MRSFIEPGERCATCVSPLPVNRVQYCRVQQRSRQTSRSCVSSPVFSIGASRLSKRPAPNSQNLRGLAAVRPAARTAIAARRLGVGRHGDGTDRSDEAEGCGKHHELLGMTLSPVAWAAGHPAARQEYLGRTGSFVRDLTTIPTPARPAERTHHSHRRRGAARTQARRIHCSAPRSIAGRYYGRSKMAGRTHPKKTSKPP